MLNRAGLTVLTLLIPAIVIEAGSAVVSRVLVHRLFSYESEFFENVHKNEFDRFVGSGFFDPQLGWNNPQQPLETVRTNCAGNEIKYHYEHGARLTPGLVSGKEEIALFGESYTFGEEVADNLTIASVLTQKYGLPAINYGVNAYGPLQALEKFKSLHSNERVFKTAVLIIMHENVWRVVNSFKPIYFPAKSDYYFGLKPYVKNGRIVDLTYPGDYESFLAEASQRFKMDFWAKPERRFPYTLSLLRATKSNTFKAMLSGAVNGPFQDEYYTNEKTVSALRTVLDEFVRYSDSLGIHPLVIFVPRNKASYRCTERFALSMNERWHRQIAHEFTDPELDWHSYKNEKYAVQCHPSPYGYERIAGFVDRTFEKFAR
jgi:hypothetical protein